MEKKRILRAALAVFLCLGLGFQTAATPALAGVRLEYDAAGNTYVVMDDQQFLLETDDDGDPYIIRDDTKTFLDPEELEAAMTKEIMPLAEESSVHDHEDGTWTAWTALTSLPKTAGHYYLTTDVKLSLAPDIPWYPADNTVLCLNGHTITGDPNIYGFNQGTIINISGITFDLVDCQNKGQVTMLERTSPNGAVGSVGVTEEAYSSIKIDTTGTNTKTGANVTIDGVTLTGFGRGINVSTRLPVNLTIKNSSISDNSHQGMYINAADLEQNAPSKITIENTKINENWQRGIYVETGRYGTPILNITDGEINGNKAGGARLAGKVTITNTEIKNNKGASSGGGIYAAELTNLTLESAEITDNSSGGVYTQANHYPRNEQRIYLKGKLVIKDNVNSGTNTVNNLQIKVDALTTQNDVYRITDVSGLTDGAHIGITKTLNAKQTLPIAITMQLNGNSDYGKIAGYFVSDNPGQKVYYNSTDNVLQLDRNKDDEAQHAVTAHTICGLKEACTLAEHGHTTDTAKQVIAAEAWTAWNESDSVPTVKGNYYLSGNVKLNATWEPESQTVLCLNGYTLSLNGGSTASSVIKPKGTFYLCDCVGGGTIAGGNEVTGIDVSPSGGYRYYYMYGGTITNCKYGVKVYGSSNDAYFYMYGGSLSSNSTGLYISESRAKATIYDGKISYNTIHGVWGNKGSFFMKGGEISDNTTAESGDYANRRGAGFYNQSACSVDITGGKIINNTAYDDGGGLYLSHGDDTSFKLSNVEITGNKAKGNGAGVHYTIGKDLAIGQGTIIKDNVKFVNDPNNAEDYTDNNLFLKYDTYNREFKSNDRITLNDSEPWTGKESIGISFNDANGLPRNEDKLFTKEAYSAEQDISQYFFSDNPTFKIISQNKHLAIKYEMPEHKHGNSDYYTLEEPHDITSRPVFITENTDKVTVEKANRLCINGKTVGELTVKDCYIIYIEDDDEKNGKIGSIIFDSSLTSSSAVILENVKVDSFTVPQGKDGRVTDGVVIGNANVNEPALVIEDYSGSKFNIDESAEVYGVKITNGTLQLSKSGADIKAITDSQGNNYAIWLGADAKIEIDKYSIQHGLFGHKYAVYVSAPEEGRVIAKVASEAAGDLLTSAAPGWVFEFADIETDYSEKNIVMRADPNYVPEKPAITITGQPTAPTLGEGETPVGKDLTVTVTSSDDNKPLTYQWKYNTTGSANGGVNVPGDKGGNSTVCMIPELEPGEYWFYCVITDGSGNTVTTNTVRVVIPEKKGDVLQPGEEIKIIIEGEEVTVKRTGDGGAVTIDKGSGNTTITLPDNNKTGEVTVDRENGNVTVPEGSTVKDGDGTGTGESGKPDITVSKGTGTVTPDGEVKVPEGGTAAVGGEDDQPKTTITGGSGGTTVTPKGDGTVGVSGGSTVKTGENGTEITIGDPSEPSGGNGGTVNKDGSVTLPDKGSAVIGGSGGGNGGTVVTVSGEDKTITPGENGSAEVPEGSRVKSETGGANGTEITLPNGGSVNGGSGEVTPSQSGEDKLVAGVDKDGDGKPDVTLELPEGGKIKLNETGGAEVPEGTVIQKTDAEGNPVSGGAQIEVGSKGGSVDKDGSLDLTKGGEAVIKKGDGESETTTTVTGGEGGSKVTPKDGGDVGVSAGTSVKTGENGLEITVGDKGADVAPGGGVKLPPNGSLSIDNGKDESGNNKPSTQITSGKDGGTVTPDPDGSVKVPDESTVQTGEKNPAITVGGDGVTVDSEGKVNLPADGSATITVPGSSDSITVTTPEGGKVDQDGKTTASKIEITGGGKDENPTVITAPADGEVTTDKDGTTKLPVGASVSKEGGNGKTTITVNSVATVEDGEPVTPTVDKGGLLKFPSGGTVEVKKSGNEVDKNAIIILPADGSISADSTGTSDVSGVVLEGIGENAKPVQNVTITLQQGTTKYMQTVSVAGGQFMLLNVKKGFYNIVAESGEKTVTQLFNSDGSEIEGYELNLPSDNVSSVLDIDETDAPVGETSAQVDKTVVGYLNIEAELVKDQEGADKVTLTMKVAAKAEAKAANVEEIKEAALRKGVGNNHQLEFLDVSVLKEIVKGGNTNSDLVSQTGTVFEIVIPFDFSGKSEITVYRYHDGSAAALTEIKVWLEKPASSDDGKFWADPETQTVHIYTNKFSTYAIGYEPENGSTPEVPAPKPENPTPKPENPTPEPETPAPSVNTGSGGGSSSSSSVNVAPNVTGGKVTISPVRPARGETVTITVTPDAGHRLDSLTVTGSGGKSVELTKVSDRQYTFVMPAGSVTVNPSFVKVDSEVAVNSRRFTDVSEDAWYAEYVEYVAVNGLMNGYADGRFGPNDNTTRGQIITVLYRYEGEPETGLSGFSDVSSSKYYAKAIAWGADNGIVKGYGANLFGPEDNITREQLAAILFRFAEFKGRDVSARADLSGFVDNGKISSYARPALEWAVASGLMNGKSNSMLDPNGFATRAEVAAMLMRFIEA